MRRLAIYDDNLPKAKSARAYAKTYRPPIPLVPAIVVDCVLAIVVNRVLADTGKIQLRVRELARGPSWRAAARAAPSRALEKAG